MLASLLTGTPLLLLGKIGEAKTEAARVIAMLLFGDEFGDSFLKIAADKVQFEDLLGFPNPEALRSNEMAFVRSKITIWDKKFTLIDEISRCNPAMQNKLLELVLEREIMGIPTGVEFVWCTMNPLEYAGSQPLDGALAGRMGYVLQVPQVIKGKEELIARVVSMRNNAQTPALKRWLGERGDHAKVFPESLRAEFLHMLERAATIYADLYDHWIDTVAKYVAAFGRALFTQSSLELDGRRMNMIGKNIVANIAIQTVHTGRGLNMDEVKVLCKEVVLRSIPWLATGVSQQFDVTKISAAHSLAAPLLNEGDALVYRIITEQNVLEKLRMFIEHRDRIDAVTAQALVASLYEQAPAGETPEETRREEALRFALRLAMPYLFLRLDNIPSEVIALSAKQYPVNLSTKGKDLGSISVETYAQAKKLAELHDRLRNSDDHIDWAAAYFAFLPGSTKTYSFDEAIQRFDTVHETIRGVADDLREFLPQKVTNVSSAAAAISDLLGDDEAEDEETDTLGRVAVGVAI